MIALAERQAAAAARICGGCRYFGFWRRAAATRLGVAAGRRRVFVSLWRRQVVAAAGFWAAATADHVDVDHGDDFVGDVELDEDLDVDVVYSLMS